MFRPTVSLAKGSHIETKDTTLRYTNIRRLGIAWIRGYTPAPYVKSPLLSDSVFLLNDDANADGNSFGTEAAGSTLVNHVEKLARVGVYYESDTSDSEDPRGFEPEESAALIPDDDEDGDRQSVTATSQPEVSPLRPLFRRPSNTKNSNLPSPSNSSGKPIRRSRRFASSSIGPKSPLQDRSRRSSIPAWSSIRDTFSKTYKTKILRQKSGLTSAPENPVHFIHMSHDGETGQYIVSRREKSRHKAGRA